MEHDLFGKPAPTFPDHALSALTGTNVTLGQVTTVQNPEKRYEFCRSAISGCVSICQVSIARSFLQEGGDAISDLRVAGNNMSTGMPYDQGILEEACQVIRAAARDHKIRLADDVNGGQAVFCFPLIYLRVTAVVTGKSTYHHCEIERDASFRFAGIPSTDKKRCERSSLTEAEYAVERGALHKQ